MKAPLTPERVAATYEYLRSWPPFAGWKLPESDAIQFRTTERRDCCGEFRSDPPQIMVSSALHWTMGSLIPTVAHEMIHLRQFRTGTDNRSQHNAEFVKIAKRVCRLYAWDYGQFVGGV